MALYMLMGSYSSDAIKAIIETGSDREAAARKAVEAAGGKLIGFYGMFGQEHNIAVIADMPGPAEYIAVVATTVLSGTIESWKSIPLYTAADLMKASNVAGKVKAAYQPPGN